MYKKLKSTNNQYGFTLIELLVVIAIIAILSVVGIVVFTGVQKGARDVKRKADINAISKAYEIKYQGSYQTLVDSDFASGKIPTPPEGGDYGGLIASDQPGFQVCAALEGNPPPCSSPSATCFCKQSSLGIYVPAPSPSPSPGPIYVAFTKPILVNANALNYGPLQTALFAISGGTYIARGVAYSGNIPSCAGGYSGWDCNYSSQLNVLQNLQGKPQISDYWMSFGSYGTVENIKNTDNGAALTALGVTTLEYNPEVTHTPDVPPSPIPSPSPVPNELYYARNEKSCNNPIVKFAILAHQMGFKAVWTPIFYDAYPGSVNNGILPYVYNQSNQCGESVDMLILQEQTFIRQACVPDRCSAINQAFSAHTIIKPNLETGIQLMSSWCDRIQSPSPCPKCGDEYADQYCSGVENGGYDYYHCDQLTDKVDQLNCGSSDIDDLAIWAMSDTQGDWTKLPGFVQALRRAN